MKFVKQEIVGNLKKVLNFVIIWWYNFIEFAIYERIDLNYEKAKSK